MALVSGRISPEAQVLPALMTGPTLSDLVQQAVEITGMQDVPVEQKAALLSDNGSGYISQPFNEYLHQVGLRHIYKARLHPQTIGKPARAEPPCSARARAAQPHGQG